MTQIDKSYVNVLSEEKIKETARSTEKKLKRAASVVKHDFDNFVRKQDENWRKQSENWGKQDNAHKNIDETLTALKPLAELVPSLKEIVENQKVIAKVGNWFVKIVSFTAVIIGIFYTLWKILTGK